MNYRNLKFETSKLLLILLLITAGVSNAVILTFWYQHFIKNTVADVERMSLIWLNQLGPNGLTKKSNLQRLHDLIGSSVHQIILSSNEGTVTFNSASLNKVTTTNSKIAYTDALPTWFSQQTTYKSTFESLLVVVSYQPQALPFTLKFHLNLRPFWQQIWGKQKIIIFYLLFNCLILLIIGFFRMKVLLFDQMDTLTNYADSYEISAGLWAFEANKINELKHLSSTMKLMVERIENDRQKLITTVEELKQANTHLYQAQQELAHSDKLAAIGRLAAGFAHEIGNPVAIIQGYFDLLQSENVTKDELKEYIQRSEEELTRVDHLLFRLMDLSKKEEETIALFPPSEVLNGLIEALAPEFSKNRIQCELEQLTCENVFIRGNCELFRQAILNLLLNSIDAITSHANDTRAGKIICSLRKTTRQNREFIELQVSDNGCGINTHNIDKIFEPFFTTKGTHEGTGLGLSVTHRIITSFNGTLNVANTSPLVTTMLVHIPISEGGADA